MEENKEEGKKKSNKKLYVLIGTGAGLVGLTVFGLWWFKWRKGTQSGNEDDLMFKLANKNHSEDTVPKEEEGTPSPKHPKTTINTPVQEQISFPLKKGDRGTLVTQLQNALIKQYGKDIFSTKKSTGFFGNETAAFLKSKGFPTTIDKETFDKILSSEQTPAQTSSTNPVPSTDKNKLFSKQAIDIAKNIWLTCSKRDLDGLIKQLQRIKDIKDYVAVNTLFKTIRTDGVRQTIVNAALSSFFLTTDKLSINEQFERIGLKYDGQKWSLSGLEGNQIMTSRATSVRSLEGIELEVPEQTLLGEIISEYGGKTKFRSIDGQYLFVPTAHIRRM